MNHDACVSNLDLREALCNDRAQGLIYEIQVPLERITSLHGILFDLDPKLLILGNPFFPPAADAEGFLGGITPVLDRHPLARFGEVRSSGTGLHLILWLEPAVELRTAGDQQRWNSIIKVVQRTLPVDPDMPGITGVTRSVGSVNGKNGGVVRVLKTGKPITSQTIEEYMERLTKAPFKEVALPILGKERISPCPVCLGDGTRLDVLDYIGKCYNGCSKVDLGDLYDRILQPHESAKSSIVTTDQVKISGRQPSSSPVIQGMISGKV